jgi:two-component system cell cycle sensor histidine kinase/response regulator CckA
MRREYTAPGGADHFRAIVESSEDAILTNDLRGIITSVNAAAERLYGYAAGEAIGRPIAMLVEDRQEHDRILSSLIAGRRTEPYETRRLRRDRTPVDVSVSVFPLRAEDGTVIGGAAIHRDISGRKRADAAARQSEERYRTLVSQLPDSAVYQYDRDLRIVAAEGALLVQTGLVSESLEGRTIWELVRPDRAEEFVASCRAALAGEPCALEWEATTGRTLDLDIVPLRAGDDGEVTGVIVLARDITERKRIDRDLHFQAQLLDCLDVAVVAADGRGRVTHWNRQAEAYYERPRDEAVGRPLAELAPLHGFGDPAGWMARLRGGEVARLDRRIERRDGTTLPLFITCTGVRDESGEVVGFAAVAMDMTAATAEAEEKRALETRLHRSQKLDAIGRLAGGIAHDFNNLVTVILNYADLVAGQLEPGRARDDVEEIRHAAERAAELTRQLLVFGRREVFHPQPVDIDEIVLDTERLLRRTIGEDVAVVTEPAGGLWTVAADRSQIEQVILNLAFNARDAMPGGGVLRIATANVVLDGPAAQRAGLTPGPHVRLTVSDDGGGMPPEVAEQAFEPFFTTKPVGAGTGLGLPTVLGVVSRAGGHVELRSQPGAGTTVDVWLPAGAAVDTEVPQPAGGDPGSGGGETVLVVEDAPAVRVLASRMLQNGGYRVVEAGSGDEALRLAAECAPDVLLTDVVMPGMSGGDLADALRGVLPELPVVFMSGYSDDVLTRHGLLERRVAFVEKPFTHATLLQAVRDTLEPVEVADAPHA